MFTKEGKRNYFIMLTAAAISAYIVVGQTIHHEKEISRHEAIAAQEKEPVYCTVREYEGKLGVFRREENMPYITIDVRVSMLPEQDREQFRSGVELFSEEELRRLIEDFSD